MRIFSLILMLMLFSMCGRHDDFYSVTKIIEIQDTIRVNEPFTFKLILKNESFNEIKLTIDDTVQKSIFFQLDFFCNGQLLYNDVANPDKKEHNYQKYYLQKNDSLVYNFMGYFRRKNDSLQMGIDGYNRIYKIENTCCENLTIDFGGMWIPGDMNLFDSMEGYNFNKRIFVIIDSAAFKKK